MNRMCHTMYKRILSALLAGALLLPAVPLAAAPATYPANAGKQFPDADTFYRSLPKKQYHEYTNAKTNIRRLAPSKNVNAILAEATHSKVDSHGIDPNRQVYIFASVSEKGHTKVAIFDAETGKKLFGVESVRTE